MTTQIGAGRRIHLLTLTTPGAEVPDGMGGWVPGPATTTGPLYGEILPAAARDLERILPSVVTASASHVVTIPYVAGVTLTSSIVFHDRDGDRTLAITGVADPEERHVQLVLACEEAK